MVLSLLINIILLEKIFKIDDENYDIVRYIFFSKEFFCVFIFFKINNICIEFMNIVVKIYF